MENINNTVSPAVKKLTILMNKLYPAFHDYISIYVRNIKEEHLRDDDLGVYTLLISFLSKEIGYIITGLPSEFLDEYIRGINSSILESVKYFNKANEVKDGKD